MMVHATTQPKQRPIDKGSRVTAPSCSSDALVRLGPGGSFATEFRGGPAWNLLSKIRRRPVELVASMNPTGTAPTRAARGVAASLHARIQVAEHCVGLSDKLWVAKAIGLFKIFMDDGGAVLAWVISFDHSKCPKRVQT